MVRVIICRNRLLGKIRDRENKFVAVDMGEILSGFFGCNFPYNVASPAEHKSCTFTDNHIRVSRSWPLILSQRKIITFQGEVNVSSTFPIELEVRMDNQPHLIPESNFLGGVLLRFRERVEDLHRIM